jgi:hypothetical protein
MKREDEEGEMADRLMSRAMSRRRRAGSAESVRSEGSLKGCDREEREPSNEANR